MTEEFLFGALRDLALLVAGSLLTLGGTWLANRAADKRASRMEDARREHAKNELSRKATEQVRELVFELYVAARKWNQEGNLDPIRFEEATFHGAEMGGELIGDGEVRSLIEDAFLVARNPVDGPEYGYVDETPPRSQTTALYDALQVLSAHLRGDSVNGHHANRIRERRAGALKGAHDKIEAAATPAF
ncbi:hypothetical protein E3T39_13030 [Cryobacterium suzukii]|uniref:Uncharacterized protein n=1 Tax=Cryobacterium suzukii TaxID=1259198 RepID=A0A4R9AE74_9MICO|nr:hypothetical protein [Cryobacterium suzukii]TFD57703.1 hypothetical protein E3T39_13030 [Cryobacterium suzukii]